MQATDSALNGFLDLVVRLAGASAGAVRVVTPSGELRLAASVGLPAELCTADALMPLSCGICGAAIRDDDTRRATRTIGCSLRDAGAICGGRSVHCALAVPLDYQNRPIGVLNLFFAPEQEPPDCVSQLLRPFGQLLGMAFENERLSRENLHASVVAERQAMAAEIHDAVAQSLTFARMRMSVLETAVESGDRSAARAYCADINGELRFAHGRLRELITQFRAGMDSHGLVASLREAAASFVNRSGIALDFACPEAELGLTHDQERHAFNIVQEALANVHKHARARRARLSVAPCNGSIEFVVEDDGCGIGTTPVREPAAEEQHYGVAIMQERAERAGGCLRIDRPVAGGTRVRLLLPVGVDAAR
ncbi:MAG TPA: ATP-binding protein [Burkholderiaceae bacterium]|nr:ATP-binding protein [Burkholderiaceae bacterium]